MDHKWPSQQECFFGPWMVKNKTTFYRVCIHPECKNVEEKPVGV